jgi:hypothetical protein
MTPQESDLPIELAKPVQRALHAAGYLRLEQLTKVSETELKQLRHALEALGLSFADEKTRKV